MSVLIAYLLASMGLTVLIVWPQGGPSAWLRERWLRPALPPAAREVLDCYVCCSLWCGLALAPAWWLACGSPPWCWAGPLMVPPLFWLALPRP